MGYICLISALLILPIWQPLALGQRANRTSGVLSDLNLATYHELMLSPNARVLRMLKMEYHGQIVSERLSVWRPAFPVPGLILHVVRP